MNYNGLKIGVFFKNYEWAEKWFSDFLNKVDNVCVARVVKNGVYPFFIELKDGTRITAHHANKLARGIAIDKAFVEPSVDDDILNYIIKPLVGHTQFVEIED